MGQKPLRRNSYPQEGCGPNIQVFGSSVGSVRVAFCPGPGHRRALMGWDGGSLLPVPQGPIQTPTASNLIDQGWGINCVGWLVLSGQKEARERHKTKSRDPAPPEEGGGLVPSWGYFYRGVLLGVLLLGNKTEVLCVRMSVQTHWSP